MTTEATEKGKEGFDIDAALNTKGFAEFLAKYPGSEESDVESESEVEKRFEAFKTKEKTKKQMRALFTDHIQNNMGVKLESGDLASVDSVIDGMVFDNPEEFSQLSAQLEEFEQSPKEIAAMEEEVKKLGGREALEAKRTELTETKGKDEEIMKLSWIWRMSVTGKTKESLMNVTKQLDEVMDALDKTGKFEQAQARLAEVRESFLSNIAGMSGVTEAVQKKVQEKMDKLIKGKDLKSFDQAWTELNKLEQPSGTGIDPLNGMGGDYRESLDLFVTDAVRKGLDESVGKIDLKSNGALAKLEQTLKPFVSRESIGSVEGAEVKTFIIDHLEKSLGAIPDTDKAKKFILARMIIKLRS